MTLNRVLKALLVTVAGLLVSASMASAAILGNIPEPTVTGPVPVTANSHPFLATDQDLDKYGYVEKEYFIEGDDAYRYDNSGAVNVTGSRITTDGPNADGTFPFKTRIVIRRPANPADFNGTVVAEWNNVTATQDIEFNWFGDPEYMLKNGYVFVGVTAQTTGVSSLKAFDNARYGSLTVDGNGAVPVNPGEDKDGLSYDIYSSALRAVTGTGTGADPLPGFNVQTVIASGESQSCGRLSTHYNKVEPNQEIVDGYLLTVCTSPLRSDRPEKTIRVITETENRSPRTEEDNGSLRHWEVAGASHLPRMAFENLDGVLSRDFLSATASCEKFPLSLVQWPFTANRAIDSLVGWTGGGAAPPHAPRGSYMNNPDFDSSLPPSFSNPRQVLARDGNGIALGAIRYPEVTVPTAVNDGTNAPDPAGGGLFSLLCGLFGSSTVFPEAKLSGLYTDYADYVNKSAAAADQLVDQDFILPQDAPRLKQFSREFPYLRPTAPMLVGDATNRGAFGLTWVGTEASDSTFEVQRKDSSAGWTKVGSELTDPTVSLADEPEGTNTYRVRSSTVIPENNIAAAYAVTTPFSENSAEVKVDRRGPQAPSVVAAREPSAWNNGGWYRTKVRVKINGRADRDLPDGSPGVGLNMASVPSSRIVKRSGRTKVKASSKDRLGNQSKTAVLTVGIDRKKPKVKLTCPKTVRRGTKATARLRIRDSQSGVRGKSKRRVRINTGRAGRKVVRVRVSDRVGHKRSARCITRIRG